MQQASGVRLPETKSLGLPSLSTSVSQVSKAGGQPRAASTAGPIPLAYARLHGDCLLQHHLSGIVTHTENGQEEWQMGPSCQASRPPPIRPESHQSSCRLLTQRATHPSILGKAYTHNHRNPETRKPG